MTKFFVMLRTKDGRAPCALSSFGGVVLFDTREAATKAAAKRLTCSQTETFSGFEVYEWIV